MSNFDRNENEIHVLQSIPLLIVIEAWVLSFTILLSFGILFSLLYLGSDPFYSIDRQRQTMRWRKNENRWMKNEHKTTFNWNDTVSIKTNDEIWRRQQSANEKKGRKKKCEKRIKLMRHLFRLPFIWLWIANKSDRGKKANERTNNWRIE